MLFKKIYHNTITSICLPIYLIDPVLGGSITDTEGCALCNRLVGETNEVIDHRRLHSELHPLQISMPVFFRNLITISVYCRLVSVPRQREVTKKLDNMHDLIIISCLLCGKVMNFVE